MKRTLRFEAFYDVPTELVWRALTDRHELTEWLMQNDFSPEIGREFTFRDKPQGGWDGIVHCKVLEIQPGSHLSYTWKSDALDTVVSWTLQPAPGGTKLVLEHAGFRGIKALIVSMMLNRGWRSTLLAKRLPRLLGASRFSVK